jgi:antitoxin ParD1/3/4
VERNDVMSIQLPADVEARIRQRVARGEFPDAGEVVREAMRLLDERDHQIEELRAKLQSGLDQLDRGAGLAFTPERVEQMRRDADVRFRRGERPNPDVAP